MTEKKKVKRVLFNFDFDSEGAHVALVSKKQGGPANGVPVLITKAVSNGIRPADPIKVEKALEQISITMSMEEFLRRWFDLWYDDAELLTRMMGMQTEWEYNQEQNEGVWDHDTWMEERLSQFKIMKSLHENPNQTIADEDFISISILQSELEESLSISKQQEENPLKLQVEKARYEQLEAVEKQHEATVAEAEQLKVAKSALETEVAELKAQIQKAVEDKEAAELAAFQESIKELIPAEQLEKVSKSLFALDADSREAVVTSLQAKKAAVENSDLFVEKTSGEDIVDPVEVKKQALSKAFAV